MLSSRTTIIIIYSSRSSFSYPSSESEYKSSIKSLCPILSWANVAISVHPQQGDLRLSVPPSGQSAGSWARTRDRRVPADLRADSQATALPTPPEGKGGQNAAKEFPRGKKESEQEVNLP
ncbi:hypothetical protein PoB_003480100 [Plakobranchus ocellatus]|uniref:Uncharacterized protein n=1 Tax=Plakobranchus ocellatus TaxID=259542 RepID=A0AAV4ANY6_9GAST|nr:hypothetical protein PoB_003480100 [Plakobranchus ocellatus]